MSAHSARHALENAALSAALGLLRILPRGWAVGLGRGLGQVWWWADRKRRRSTTDNLRHAGLAADEAGCRALAEQSFREYGANMLDALSCSLLSQEKLASGIRWEGWENLEAAQAGGRGVLLMSAHLGSFEVGAWAVAGRRPPVHLVSRRLPNPKLDAKLRSLRNAHDIEIVEREGALRAFLRVLRAGGRIGVTIDQRVHPEQAIELPFFGRRVFVSFGPAALALKTGSAILPVFTRREGRGHCIQLGEPIVAEGQGARAVEALTARCLAVLEDEIRKAPAAWTWQHRFWRDSDAQLQATSSVARELRGEDESRESGGESRT